MGKLGKMEKSQFRLEKKTVLSKLCNIGLLSKRTFVGYTNFEIYDIFKY